MGTRTKRLVILPLGALALAAVVVFALGRFGVVDTPWTDPQKGSVAVAGDQGEGGTDGNDDDEEEVIPVPVELARVGSRQISAYYRASSFVEADRQVQLVSKVVGRVQKVNVEEGDWVSRGDVLAELENGRERVMLHQSELKLADQKRELDRMELLLQKNLVTQDEFDDKRSAHDLATADLDLGKITVEETLIRSPFDGQVTRRLCVAGQHINLAEPLFTLVDFEPLRVRIHLPEVVARKISPGDEVEVIVEALEHPVPAVVERIAPVVDPATSTVRLTLLLEGNPRDIRVGGFVKVRVTTDIHHEALAVPKLALVEEGGLRSVFVAEGDSVRKVEVRTGLYDESHCEVLDGLEDGDCVVSLGQGGLRSGSRIDVLNPGDVDWVVEAEEEDDDDREGSSESDPEASDAEVALSDGAGDEE